MKKRCRHTHGGTFFSINMSNVGHYWCEGCGAYRLSEQKVVRGSVKTVPVRYTKWRYPKCY